MKLLGFNILKQKTLEERLAKARNEAVVMPNKMITIMRQHGLVRNRIISKLLWQIHSPQRIFNAGLSKGSDGFKREGAKCLLILKDVSILPAQKSLLRACRVDITFADAGYLVAIKRCGVSARRPRAARRY